MTNKEFKHIAPELSKLKKIDNGFNVPKNYFEGIELRIEKKLDLNGESSFSTPKGYFDSIEDQVFDKINNTSKVIQLKDRITKVAIPLLAASLLLIFTLKSVNSDPSSDVFAKINDVEIENWIENGELELSTYEIAALYSDSNFDELELENEFNDDELIDYLEDIDVESLILTN